MIQSITTDQKLQYTIFATLYIASGTQSGLSSLENNYAGIDITQYWGEPGNKYFKNTNQYYCSSTNTPYAIFDTLEACVTLLSERWKNRIDFKHVTSDVITRFWILNNNTNKVRPSNVYDTYNEIDLQSISAKVTESINIFTGANHN
jgi:Txe/YoeB family toxin of Txe-Axe toxin-antitoxin module